MKNFFIFLLIFTSCQYLQPKKNISKKIVAKVGAEELATSSITELIPLNLSKKDSAIFVEKFVVDWVKKQLMIAQAKQAIDFNEARIQKRVLDYQYALLVHELEKKYIDINLNDEVSDEEIAIYYKDKSENFVLRETLVKCIYFKIPSKSLGMKKFRRYFKNYPTDSTQLWEFTNKYSVKKFTEDSVWVKFDEVLLETPLKKITDRVSFLKENKTVEVSDKEYEYFIKIFDQKLIGEIAPLAFIRDNIIDIIINKRKINLKKELEKKIYKEAKQKNAFEIYSH